ncbi:thioredoxin-like protein [Ramicandelaber brevisporus]|nr:thioredoxin-like protein [Ramicandelaber brevisporus]
MPHKELTIYVDIISGYSYVLTERLALHFEHMPEWKPNADFSIKLVMVNLPGLFIKCSNPLFSGTEKNKLPQLMRDIKWAVDTMNVPFVGPAHKSISDANGNFIRPELALAVLQMLNDEDQPFHQVYNAYRLFQLQLLGHGISVQTADLVADALEPAFDRELALAWAKKAEENKEKLLAEIEENTDKLFELGGFGCPTLLPKQEGEDVSMLFFGSDRLEHAAHILGLDYLPVGKFKSNGFKPLSS